MVEPPRLIVEPAKYNSFHLFVGEPKSYVSVTDGLISSLTADKSTLDPSLKLATVTILPPFLIKTFLSVILTATSPEDTAKLSELNEAIPLFDVVASSPVIVNVFEAIAVTIPSPLLITNVSPRATASVDESLP